MSNQRFNFSVYQAAGEWMPSPPLLQVSLGYVVAGPNPNETPTKRHSEGEMPSQANHPLPDQLPTEAQGTPLFQIVDASLLFAKSHRTQEIEAPANGQIESPELALDCQDEVSAMHERRRRSA
jgi:hypothetical protein